MSLDYGVLDLALVDDFLLDIYIIFEIDINIKEDKKSLIIIN